MRHSREVSVSLAAAAFVMMAGSSAALATIEASMCIIDGDLVITTDGDPGRQITIKKGDTKQTKDKFRKATKSLGFTGSSHTVSPWSSVVWPPGSYSFKGKDADGVEMLTTATLDDCEADPAEVVTVDSCAPEDFGTLPAVDGCDADDGLVDGTPGDVFEVVFAESDGPACSDIDHYVFHFQCEDFPVYTAEIDPADCDEGSDDDCLVAVPGADLGFGLSFTDDDVMCTIEITTVDEDTCNETTSTLTYETSGP